MFDTITKRSLTMTRNDIDSLARHLAAMNPGNIAIRRDHTAGYIEGYRAAINQVCGAISANHPRFNSNLFRKQCAKQ